MSGDIDQSQTATLTTGPIRVPGTYPPEWLPDHETDTCMSCDSLFTLVKRRHHCRSCGKIFCGDCCRQKAKLLYLDNKEARVCSNCYRLIDYTLIRASSDTSVRQQPQQQEQQHGHDEIPSSSQPQTQTRSSSSSHKVQGVLKTGNQSRASVSECNTSSPDREQLNKQVIFSDGIRPGTDLSESFPYPMPSSSSASESPSPSPFSLLTRQSRRSDCTSSGKKNKISKTQDNLFKNITVCDELGYLPPIVITKNSSVADSDDPASVPSSSSSIANFIVSQFKLPGGKKDLETSMESRNCPLNGVIRFEEISGFVGVDNVVTFLLLKDFYLKVKLVRKNCCLDPEVPTSDVPKKEMTEGNEETEVESVTSIQNETPEYWSFASEGLARYGQNEIVIVIDKDKRDFCIPRDVFKIYLTLHELALRRQSLENLGNLLFQDGLFGNRDTAGLIFVKPLADHCLKNLILPNQNFLIALVLQRWEVPWSKVFPVRLLLRLGHKLGVYPYPIVSFRARDPVYYEVGHTIISILGDFRNFRYSITHVDGLKVMLNKKTRKVLVQLDQSSYQQFNKVLDSSNNEHVLAWSSYPFPEASGHLVSVQNEDGQYETVEFYKKSPKLNNDDSGDGAILGASFIIFSGALKVNQTGQSAKISIVEDGLLIQIQSCTMSALKNAIHFMNHFDIDCGKYRH